MAAATEKFGSLGFAETTVDSIASDASVAKGAVYHHFRNKDELFECVFERVSSDLAQSVASAVRTEGGPLESLMEAVKTYFRLCSDPAIARITLQDAPSVLGYERWRALDTAHFGGLVTGGLGFAMQAGALAPQPLEPLSKIVLAAIQAAALECAAHDDFDAAASTYVETLEGLLAGLARKY
ncbi:TetR/AcrR family transcriptional regulator [Erythrobacter donghaensis]|uniref:TetR/AcrR family transcriptional regulator n=1 Tax=Erythrobacter donghaensis TaxID=267135 RepID=UPI00093AEC87|nr:TetR/AcrR family transcriptional regulator [Erythrobacter donghaensis]